MQLHWSIPAAGTGLCLSLLTTGAARAASFTFTKIADTSSTFSSFFTSPSINDAGTVAFSAALDTGGTGVFTGSGGPITNIALSNGVSNGVGGTTSVLSSILTNPSINNAGRVAFGASTSDPSNSLGVYTGTGIPGEGLTTIANFSFGLITLAGSGISPVINDAGTVALTAFIPPPFPVFTGPSIFTGNGGPLTTLISPDGNLNEFALNNAGTIAFSKGNGYLSNGGLFTVGSSGGPVTTVVKGGSYGGPISINGAGTIALGAGFNAGHTAIFTVSSNGGPLTTVVSGGFSFAPGILTQVYTPSINDDGTVAFLASLRGKSDQGLFIGPDPETDQVIASGDSLFGSTVASSNSFQNIGFSTRGLNNRGQLAFYAQLTDGTSGIFRADPITVPESSFSVLNAFWLSALGGAMLKRYRKEVG